MIMRRLGTLVLLNNIWRINELEIANMEKDFYIANMNNIAWVKILLYPSTWKISEIPPVKIQHWWRNSTEIHPASLIGWYWPVKILNNHQRRTAIHLRHPQWNFSRRASRARRRNLSSNWCNTETYLFRSIRRKKEKKYLV